MSSRRIAAVAAITSLLLLLPLLLMPRLAHGQQAPPAPAAQRLEGKLRVPDSTHAQILELRDGSTLLGRIEDVTADSVRFRTSFALVGLDRGIIRDVKLVRRPSTGPSGELWPADPNATRLFFGPTGRTLEAGDGYFADTYLLFVNYFQGVTDRVTLGAGTSILPTEDFIGDNVMYLMPKVGVVKSDLFNVSIGGLVAAVPEGEGVAGIGYAVGTAGTADASVTGGLGYGFVDGEMADRPLVMLGAVRRLSRRAAFVTENYMIPGMDGVLVSYGFRFFGERMAFDAAFWNVFGSGDSIPFLGIPYVAFTIHR